MVHILRKKISDFLSNHKADETVLSLGAGTRQYREYFPNQIATDVIPNRKLDVMCDTHNVCFRDESFSTVLCLEVFEHLKDPQKAADEIYRILKKNGKLILTTRFMFPYHDSPHDYFRYTRDGLRHLFRDWSSVDIKPDTSKTEFYGSLVQIHGDNDLGIRGVRFFFKVLGAMVSALPSRNYKYACGYHVIAIK